MCLKTTESALSQNLMLLPKTWLELQSTLPVSLSAGNLHHLNKRMDLSGNTSSMLWNWKLETGSNLTYLIQPSPSQGFIHFTTISAMCLLSPQEQDHTPYQSQFNCYKQVCTLQLPINLLLPFQCDVYSVTMLNEPGNAYLTGEYYVEKK